jgi:MFS family permease
MAQDEDHLEPRDLGHDVEFPENERSPLLSDDSSCCSETQVSPSYQPPELHPFSMVIVCFLLSILLEVGLYLIAVPLNAILERNICRNILPGLLDTDDNRCKEKATQSELSFIRGWQATFDIIPGLLTAVPYGLMADKYGRELVLSLSVLGGTITSSFNVLVCSSATFDFLRISPMADAETLGSLPSVFSPRMIWLSSAFGFIGGGAPVFNAITFAIISSAVSEKKRYT